MLWGCSFRVHSHFPAFVILNKNIQQHINIKLEHDWLQWNCYRSNDVDVIAIFSLKTRRKQNVLPQLGGCDAELGSVACLQGEETLSQASPLAVNNPLFDLWFLFQTLMNEAAKGNRGFISDLHLHFNLENQSGAGAARWWAADVPACLSKQSSTSASAVCVSPSTTHLPLSFHACVTILWEGLLWKLHLACGQWMKIPQHTGNCSVGHPAICFCHGIAGRATVPPSGKTKPGYCYHFLLSYWSWSYTSSACFSYKVPSFENNNLLPTAGYGQHALEQGIESLAMRPLL